MSFRHMVADSKDTESDTGQHSRIMYLALCWAELCILHFFIKIRTISTKAREASSRARSMRSRLQSSPGVITDDGNPIIHVYLAISQPQPFRIFTIRHRIAELR